MKKVITFNDPSIIPDEHDQIGHIILCTHWLPEEERTHRYRPEILGGEWKDGRWWKFYSVDKEIGNDGTEENKDEFLTVWFKQVDPKDLIGWASLHVRE